MPKAPEQEARARIDAQLAASGLAVQDLRQVRLKSGPCDYLLLVEPEPVGVVEAKKEVLAV